MSGSIGANRIPREAVEPTVKKYIENILKKYPPFRNAKISGSYNTVVKPDHGDLDLIVHVDAGENDKKTLKKKFAEYLNSLPDDVIVPFKAGRHQGKKTAGTGDIVITQIPIEGYPDLTVQVDNMIVTSEREGDYRKSFLDVPGEKQALLIGLVKTVLMEEDPKKVFARLGIKDLPSLDDNQEFEFNLSSKGLTLRLVTLGDDFKELGRNEIWSSYNWDDVVKLLVKYDLSLPFGDLLKQIKAKLANPRSKNRVKGLFKSMLVIGAGEKGTSKGDNKEAALNAVNALLENKLCKGLVESLILPFLIENIGETQFNFPPNETIALYPGKFKPPHKGHLDVVNQLTRIADQVYVLISPKPHEGITAEQSLDIWEKLYSPLISDRRKIKFVISQLTPVKDVYDIITDNPDTNFIAAYGKEDAGRYSKLNSDRVKTYDAGNVEGISATNLRAALNSQGDITPFIPEEVSPIRYLETLGVLLHETLKEYKNQNTLNPVVFNGLEIKPKVKEVLLKIADEFWNSLELDIDYDDVLLLGSSANYNWTPYSDVDLHILVDFDEFEDPKIAKKYFDSAKSRFNDAHNLKIKNNDIEVYVQNSKEPNASVGVYSLLNDKWLQKPQYGKMEIPDKEIENKAKPFKSKIDKILRTKPTPNNYDFLTDSIKGLQDKLKKFRQIGLETGGEYSIENLAFKNLRNTGYIEKLLNYKTEIMDKVLSIKEVFDRPVDSYPFNEPGEGTYLFISDSGNKYVVYIDEVNENRIVIDFGISDETGDIDYPETNVGELYKVMSTIIAIAKDYISKHPEIEIISWSSVAKRGQKKIGDTQRDKLYKLILKKQGGLSDKDIKLINGEWWAYLKGYDPMFEDLSPESDDELLSPDDLSALDQYADSALNPIDVDLDPKSDRHFLDRAIERGVTKGELKDFFARLGLKKDNLKYLFTKAKEKGDKDIVVTDKKTNINIPFEDTTSSAKDRMANRIKSIGAKTIHKKPNFHTPNVRLTFAENIQNSQTPEQVRDFQTLLLSLTNHLQDNLSITPLPKIKFINDDIDNANNILGRTAYYNPTEKSITLYTYGRHPKDVLRSYSHEMIHHKQNLEGRLERKIYTTNINEDDNLLELEREAYELGNLLFRSWENGLDNKND
jgi:cytidyltransferase-like protein